MLLLLFLTASVLVIWAKQTGLGKVFSGTEQKGREERGSDVLRCHALASAGTDAPEGRGQGRWRVFANGTLAIARAGLEDRGQYLCTAANPHGTAQLLVTLSVVAYPPRIAGGRWQLLTAHSGKPVAVACRAEGRPPPTIAWVLANKTHVSDSSTGNNDVRVEPDGTLIIKEATVYDRGLYTCVARNPAGTDTLVVKLQVVAAPPAILEEKRERVEGTMGENLKLPCTVTGNPRPAFVNGKLFLFANGTLHLSTIAPSDSGNYECIATSSTGSDRRVVTLVVERRDTLPKIATASQEMTRLNFGDKLLLNCTATGEPKIVVHKNGTLEIRNIRPSDTAEFICVARNDGGESMLVVQLEVVEMLRRPTFKNPFNEKIIAKPGKATTLNCSVDGNPPPDISWMLPNGTWFSGSIKTSQFLTGSHGTLTISSPDTAKAGRYRCAAKNKVGYIEKLLIVEVGQKPNILTRPAGPVKGISGESLSLHCLSEGSPRPRTAWTLPGGSVLERPQLGRKHVLLENGTLLIRDASIHDRGDYVCRAHNNAGESSVTVPVVILPDRSLLSTDNTGRASGSQLLHPSGTLLIQNPQPSDSGAYKCTAKNHLGSDFTVTYVHII
uniref:Immunoglobulin superfamily member 10 n=1 Tax=Otus sunia TaxID=257818 RepID=A0A8C8AHQ5_9STRI